MQDEEADGIWSRASRRAHAKVETFHRVVFRTAPMDVTGGAKAASSFGALGMLARAYFVTSARHDAPNFSALDRLTSPAAPSLCTILHSANEALLAATATFTVAALRPSFPRTRLYHLRGQSPLYHPSAIPRLRHHLRVCGGVPTLVKGLDLNARKVTAALLQVFIDDMLPSPPPLPHHARRAPWEPSPKLFCGMI